MAAGSGGSSHGAGRKRYAAAGLVAAAVVLLKHLYLLIVLAFVAQAAVRSWRRDASIADIQHALWRFAIGLAAPLFVVFLYFVVMGQVGRVWWASFEVAPAQQLLAPRPLRAPDCGCETFHDRAWSDSDSCHARLPPRTAESGPAAGVTRDRDAAVACGGSGRLFRPSRLASV